MNLLHIDGSILGPHSVSRTVSAAIVDRLKASDGSLQVTYRDLAETPIPHLTGAHLPTKDGTAPPDPEAALGAKVLDEFLAADIVVIGAPLYNFSISSQLKAWIDRILVAGKTFRYSEAGPEGLAGGKRVIVALARGGFYGAGTPRAAAEHAETYLRTVLGFIGIAQPEVIVAEGLSVGPDVREKAIADALQAAGALRAA